MTDDDVVAVLRRAMADETRGHRLDEAVVRAALDTAGPARRRAPRWRGVAAGAAASVAVAGVAVGVALAAHRDAAGPAAPAAQEVTCTSTPVVDAALPVWARDGSTDPSGAGPHVTGTGGRIVAVLFTQPLRVHQAPGRFNKVLWVARGAGRSGPSAGAALVVRAQLLGAGRTVTRRFADGPGPSILDLPAPGCWRLTLTWSGRTDHLALRYRP